MPVSTIMLISVSVASALVGFIAAIWLEERRPPLKIDTTHTREDDPSLYQSDPDEFAIKLGTYDISVSEGYMVFQRRSLATKEMDQATIEYWFKKPASVTKESQEPHYVRIAKRLQELDGREGA